MSNASETAAPVLRYFSAQNCRRWPELFEPFDTIGGILWGICATADPEKQQSIDALIAQPKLGVSETSEEDYAKQKQKKTATSPGLDPWKPNPGQSSTSPVNLAGSGERRPAGGPVVGPVGPVLPFPPPAEALKGKGNAVVGETVPAEVPLEAGLPVPTVAEALQLGEVEQAPTAKSRLSARKNK